MVRRDWAYRISKKSTRKDCCLLAYLECERREDAHYRHHYISMLHKLRSTVHSPLSSCFRWRYANTALKWLVHTLIYSPFQSHSLRSPAGKHLQTPPKKTRQSIRYTADNTYRYSKDVVAGFIDSFFADNRIVRLEFRVSWWSRRHNSRSIYFINRSRPSYSLLVSRLFRSQHNGQTLE